LLQGPSSIQNSSGIKPLLHKATSTSQTAAGQNKNVGGFQSASAVIPSLPAQAIETSAPKRRHFE
jgi:hypothetical protein